jgi:hypothetical protein
MRMMERRWEVIPVQPPYFGFDNCRISILLHGLKERVPRSPLVSRVVKRALIEKPSEMRSCVGNW